MPDPEQNILSGSELVIEAVGSGLTTFVIGAETPEHPFEFTAITSTVWPFVRALVVYVFDTPLCTLLPLTLKV
jgi:hypothetical protein